MFFSPALKGLKIYRAAFRVNNNNALEILRRIFGKNLSNVDSILIRRVRVAKIYIYNFIIVYVSPNWLVLCLIWGARCLVNELLVEKVLCRAF